MTETGTTERAAVLRAQDEIATALVNLKAAKRAAARVAGYRTERDRLGAHRFLRETLADVQARLDTALAAMEPDPAAREALVEQARRTPTVFHW